MGSTVGQHRRAASGRLEIRPARPGIGGGGRAWHNSGMQAFIAVQTAPSLNPDRPPEISRLIVLAESEAEAASAFQAYVEPSDTVAIVAEQPDPAWLADQRVEKALLPGKVQPYSAPLR